MEVEGDNRPFVTVDVMGLKVTGLLDSGAQVSILGAGGDRLLRKLNLREFDSKRKLFSAGAMNWKLEDMYTSLSHSTVRRSWSPL